MRGMKRLSLAICLLLVGAGCTTHRHEVSRASGPMFIDATLLSGLPLVNSARLVMADLDGDHRPDVVMRVHPSEGGDAYRVFLNRADLSSPLKFKYVEVSSPGLPQPLNGDCVAFADLDNDGFSDAVFTRYLDTKSAKFAAPTTMPTSTCWLKGNGDGTFAPPQLIEAATRATTACLAIGDANCDGLPDILLGNWYDQYGQTNTAYPTDLLIQRRSPNNEVSFVRVPLPEDGVAFDEEHDQGPRPTYGILFIRLDGSSNASPAPSILQMNYGRRWNRLYVPTDGVNLQYVDRAAEMHIDGDAIRHGRYPDWLKEVAKKDKRFEREDEKPFRSNGNNFDAAIGDVNGDGKFDLFFAAITHAWAGESSDPSRFVLQREVDDKIDFAEDARLSVDRPGTHPEREPKAPATLPATLPTTGSTTSASTQPARPNWNQGDLFCRLADMNQDGRLDLILASSDYPDPPPHENRLRVYLQQPDGTFADSNVGIDQIGAQQISLADVDGDGDLDLLVGQSFNRFSKAMIDARTLPGPVARLFLNQTAEQAGGKSIVLHLTGDPSKGVTRDALNTIVELTTRVDGRRITQIRQLLGPSGHNGKGGDLAIHFGLGTATEAEEIRIKWPGVNVPDTILIHVKAGTHSVSQSQDR